MGSVVVCGLCWPIACPWSHPCDVQLCVVESVQTTANADGLSSQMRCGLLHSPKRVAPRGAVHLYPLKPLAEMATLRTALRAGRAWDTICSRSDVMADCEHTRASDLSCSPYCDCSLISSDCTLDTENKLLKRSCSDLI